MDRKVDAAIWNLTEDARLLLDVWLSIRVAVSVPEQVQFDPARVPQLLPNIWIYRFEQDRGDFVCRIAGEDINQAWGGSIKGLSLRQIVGEERHPQALARWQEIISVPQIQHGRVDKVWDGTPTCVAERLILPMSGGGQPDRVLGFSRYLNRQTDRERVPPVWGDVTQIRCADL